MCFHGFSGGPTLFTFAILSLVYVRSMWWRDVSREGVLGFHTRKVKNGLHLGMLLFIVSEAMFFVGQLWAVMHAALMPTTAIGMAWPPVGIVPVSVAGLPFRNTQQQLRSYFTCNAALYSVSQGNKSKAAGMLWLTVGLGALFMFGQYQEYCHARFTFSDSVFGSTFYLTTGFHGFHVIVGAIYLAVCIFLQKSSTPTQHSALQLSALYWHFVDIVWVFVLLIVYVWGGLTPSTEISRCADGSCAFRVIQHDARAFAAANETALQTEMTISQNGLEHFSINRADNIIIKFIYYTDI